MTGYLHRLGISVIPYLGDWLIHRADHQVLLRHQAQLISTLDLNRKKSKLDLTQDLQFLGIRLRLDLGEASLPESKAWEIVARAGHLSSLRVLTYSQVSQFMGSLNWASDFIPLGRLYLRPIQPHLSGLTDRFTPRHRSDPLDRSYQLSGAQCRSLCTKALGPSAPGPPGYDRYGQFDSSFVYQQARRDPFPHLVGPEHYSPSKTYSRLSERDSRPPISSESANIDRVEPPPQDSETYLRALGDTKSRLVCDSVKLPPSLVHVSNSGATSPSGGCSVSGLAGEVNVHVSSIPSAQKCHSEAPVHPDGRSDSHSPLVAETVVVSIPTCTSSLCGSPPVLSLPSRSSVPAWRLSCDTIKQQAFHTRSLGSPQPLGGPQPIACATIGGFASLDGPEGKGLIRLIHNCSDSLLFIYSF